MTAYGLKSFKDWWTWNFILGTFHWPNMNALVNFRITGSESEKSNSSSCNVIGCSWYHLWSIVEKIDLNLIITFCLATLLIGHTLRKRSVHGDAMKKPFSEVRLWGFYRVRVSDLAHLLKIASGKIQKIEEPNTIYRYCLDSDSNNFTVKRYYWDSQDHLSMDRILDNVKKYVNFRRVKGMRNT